MRGEAVGEALTITPPGSLCSSPREWTLTIYVVFTLLRLVLHFGGSCISSSGLRRYHPSLERSSTEPSGPIPTDRTGLRTSMDISHISTPSRHAKSCELQLLSSRHLTRSSANLPLVKSFKEISENEKFSHGIALPLPICFFPTS